MFVYYLVDNPVEAQSHIWARGHHSSWMINGGNEMFKYLIVI